MANTVYSNVVLENKISDQLDTQLNVRGLMTMDDSLVENAGMIKKINTYAYSGSVENVAEGDGNSAYGEVSFSTSQYEVDVAQHSFQYTDEQFMTDPMVLEVGVKGGATVMANDMTSKFFGQCALATLKQEYAHDASINYDTIVDAISLMNLEGENGLFLLIGTDLKAALRKDADFKASLQGEILYTGQIGTISGVPVIVSKEVPADTAYLLTKEAITLYTKKDSEVEQDRDIEKRKNTIVMRRVNLVALTDATKIVKIVKGAEPTPGV